MNFSKKKHKHVGKNAAPCEMNDRAKEEGKLAGSLGLRDVAACQLRGKAWFLPAATAARIRRQLCLCARGRPQSGDFFAPVSAAVC